jgi:hypothetical protein
MKLTTLAITLLLVSSVAMPNRWDLTDFQETTERKSSDLQKLEAQFKQIDEESDSVKVDVTGNKESSGSVNIIVQRNIYPTTATTATTTATASEAIIRKETLLNIDLSNIDVSDAYINEKIATAFSTPSNRGTLPGVKVMQVGASEIYEVVEDYTYDAVMYKITVLKGFKYDRATVPRIFWVLIDKDSLSNVAPLFHDLLYQHGGVLPQTQVSPYRRFSRKDTDDLFLELMTKCDVKKWRREAAYQAVRKFSGPFWKAGG